MGFVYLGNKMTTDGACAQEINIRIGKDNKAFTVLKSILKVTGLSLHITFMILGSVLSAASSCKDGSAGRPPSSSNRSFPCLRRILKVLWPNLIANENLGARTGVGTTEETM